jgi:hypothetical protein
MRNGPKRVFLIVILDEDQKTFETRWMTDDQDLNDRVYAAQKAGRNVRCFSSPSSQDETARHLMAKGYGPGRVALGSTQA